MSMELMVKAMKIRVGNPLRKLVLIKLADNASDQGECWPSYQHIADQCEISKRSVMNHIAALCESGLVKKVTRKGEKGNSSNIYLLHLDGAGDSLSGRQMETKEVDAERMLHLKFVRRLHQMRGTSLLSGVLIRLSALKDYEDYELTAARIAAALGMYIRKGDGQSYEPDGNGSKDKERELTIQPGIIYDDLKPGEEIGMVKSDRPNPNLETFRNGQLRAVAAGSRLSFSSTARNYNGTYSAQRQELVESTDGYLILQDWFIGAVTRPMYRAWLKQAVASGVIRLPRDLDRSSLYTAVYSGPVMPWIDPVKEAEAWKIQIRGGAATESDWVRAGGRNPDDVKRRRKAEIDENRKLDLVFDTDPASDKGGSSAATKRQEPQHTDDQSED
ncbi:TPA: phage portal protein [Escherichia coli]|nr:phage portal protein [Escherichia coli]